jgi:hypothetical protein
MIFMLAAALAPLPAVASHTRFTTLGVNGVDQGDRTDVRMLMTLGNATNPTKDFLNEVMACGKQLEALRLQSCNLVSCFDPY